MLLYIAFSLYCAGNFAVKLEQSSKGPRISQAPLFHLEQLAFRREDASTEATGDAQEAVET